MNAPIKAPVNGNELADQAYIFEMKKNLAALSVKLYHKRSIIFEVTPCT